MTAPTIFISHANEDNATAKRLTKRLRDDGFDPWLDDERLLPGQDWKLEIEKAMRASNAILVCFSEKSVSKSGFVQKEFKRALEIQEEKPEGAIFVIPVRFDKSEPPFSFRELQWVDYPDGYDRIVMAVNRLADQPNKAKPEAGKSTLPSRKKTPKASAAQAKTRISKNTSSPQVDFLIVTALEKEAKAIVRLLDSHKIERDESKDIRTYHLGTIPIRNTSHSYQAVVVVLPSMGELPAAMAATDAIAYWNPRFVFMVGIAGGIPQDDLDLGDVVVADQVVGYDYGKAIDEKIKPRDRVYPASALLLERVRNFWDETWAKQIHETRPGNAKRPLSKRFVGPIASGNKVIASTKFRDSLLERWPKLIAIETESEGVYSAVFDRPQIRGTLVVRGICDMADERKGDEWQEFAADAAATYLIQFLKSGPVDQVVVTSPKPPSPSLPPSKIFLAKLPSTDPTLFGREKELKELDEAWDNPKINIVSIVAWGGVGKTALVNKWLSGLGESYRGAERVFGWSFYSQGAAEGRQVSADQFIATALAWFGDPDPKSGSAWDKGERLAELIKQQRTLLILDGLEPLQNPPPIETGKIKDPGLSSLLRELARQNPGLVVISTRLAVDDLKDCVGETVIEHDLENLSDEAGAEYLRHLGVDGTGEELQDAVKDFGRHALALTLMGRYLVDFYNGDIRIHHELPPLFEEEEKGGHAKRIMRAYEKWFESQPELDLLKIMGLFDRPADKGAIDALLAAPIIDGLTNKIQRLPIEKYKLVLKHLRKARLLAEQESNAPDTLDCHPLLREHFGEQLKAKNPAAWRQANERLYEYYKTSAKEYPDTLQEMAPLFAAVMHGCQAEKHQEAFIEVYWKRIQRGKAFFNKRNLGAFGSELAVLSGFFDSIWSKPIDGLREDWKGFILNEASMGLRALGRLVEATQPMQASLGLFLAQKNWKLSAVVASNLSELYLTIGDVRQALGYAEQSVQFADKSEEGFERMVFRVRYADCLHQANRLSESQATFHEAEEMQKKRQPEFPLLYSKQGFEYCDLLLSQRRAAEVERRANNDLNMYKQDALSDLLSLALAYLSLGRAKTLTLPSPTGRGMSEGQGEGDVALTYLTRAVDGLRQAGTQHHLPQGLLARAEVYRIVGDFRKAQKDLDEAFAIATRGGMGLHLADCHLGYARLTLADERQRMEDGRSKAREHVKTAKEMIERMGYHRRDKEVQELEKDLDTGSD